jgi:hypothetical protein
MTQNAVNPWFGIELASRGRDWHAVILLSGGLLQTERALIVKPTGL